MNIITLEANNTVIHTGKPVSSALVKQSSRICHGVMYVHFLKNLLPLISAKSKVMRIMLDFRSRF